MTCEINRRAPQACRRIHGPAGLKSQPSTRHRNDGTAHHLRQLAHQLRGCVRATAERPALRPRATMHQLTTFSTWWWSPHAQAAAVVACHGTGAAHGGLVHPCRWCRLSQPATRATVAAPPSRRRWCRRWCIRVECFIAQKSVGGAGGVSSASSPHSIEPPRSFSKCCRNSSRGGSWTPTHEATHAAAGALRVAAAP